MAAAVQPTQLSSIRLLKTLMWSFALILGLGVVHAVVMGFRFDDLEEMNTAAVDQVLIQILIVEAADTLIVAYVLLTCLGSMRSLANNERRSLAAWLLGFPILACLLFINFQYHEILREQIRVPIVQDVLVDGRRWLVFLAVCVQPAIVEEAYFRGFALRTLRTVMGRHSAVWITALMFALAHVAMPLSIPYLFLFGGIVGYLRIWSGGVWLPMVLHLTHNLVVTMFEAL